MWRVLRQRNIALLWLGGLISSLGDWLLFIALPFHVYNLTGSTLATGAMFIVESIPSIVLSSFAGVFVDRWNRRRTMIGADLLRGLALLPLLLLQGPQSVWVVYVVAFVVSVIGQFFNPAHSALVPSLVAEADLLSTNALNSTSNELTHLIGPPLGGFILGALGLGSVVVLDSLSFIISALLVALIVVPTTPAKPPTEDPQANGQSYVYGRNGVAAGNWCDRRRRSARCLWSSVSRCWGKGCSRRYLCRL